MSKKMYGVLTAIAIGVSASAFAMPPTCTGCTIDTDGTTFCRVCHFD